MRHTFKKKLDYFALLLAITDLLSCMLLYFGFETSCNEFKLSKGQRNLHFTHVKELLTNPVVP